MEAIQSLNKFTTQLGKLIASNKSYEEEIQAEVRERCTTAIDQCHTTITHLNAGIQQCNTSIGYIRQIESNVSKSLQLASATQQRPLIEQRQEISQIITSIHSHIAEETRKQNELKATIEALKEAPPLPPMKPTNTQKTQTMTAIVSDIIPTVNVASAAAVPSTTTTTAVVSGTESDDATPDKHNKCSNVSSTSINPFSDSVSPPKTIVPPPITTHDDFAILRTDSHDDDSESDIAPPPRKKRRLTDSSVLSSMVTTNKSPRRRKLNSRKRNHSMKSDAPKPPYQKSFFVCDAHHQTLLLADVRHSETLSLMVSMPTPNQPNKLVKMEKQFHFNDVKLIGGGNKILIGAEMYVAPMSEVYQCIYDLMRGWLKNRHPTDASLTKRVTTAQIKARKEYPRTNVVKVPIAFVPNDCSHKPMTLSITVKPNQTCEWESVERSIIHWAANKLKVSQEEIALEFGGLNPTSKRNEASMREVLIHQCGHVRSDHYKLCSLFFAQPLNQRETPNVARLNNPMFSHPRNIVIQCEDAINTTMQFIENNIAKCFNYIGGEALAELMFDNDDRTKFKKPIDIRYWDNELYFQDFKTGYMGWFDPWAWPKLDGKAIRRLITVPNLSYEFVVLMDHEMMECCQ